MFKKTLGAAALGSAVLIGFNFASAEPEATPAVTQSTNANNDAIRTSLTAMFSSPTVVPTSVEPTAIAGVWEVFFGAQVIYTDTSGRYLFTSNRDGIQLIDRIEGRNLTKESVDARTRPAAKKVLAALKESDTVNYKPKNGTKHVLTVFTDIDCYYCQKFHNEMDSYLAQGIEIRYAFYPRAGYNSASGQSAQNVWCADDKAATMTIAKAEAQRAQQAARSGIPVPPSTVVNKTCTNPIQNHMQQAGTIGVNSTPNLLTASGTLIPGYMPAATLIAELEKDKAKFGN